MGYEPKAGLSQPLYSPRTPVTFSYRRVHRAAGGAVTLGLSSSAMLLYVHRSRTDCLGFETRSSTSAFTQLLSYETGPTEDLLLISVEKKCEARCFILKQDPNT